MQKSARDAALEILERCRRDKAWSGAAIDNSIKKYGFDRRDAAFVSRLCLGVMQNTRLCDFYIDNWCTTKLEPKVRDILRLGVYQILFLDKVPDSAAVNESVALCRKSGNAKAAGLVNAVLRRVSDNKSNLPEIPDKGTAKHLAIKYSHPEWIANYIIALHGYEFAEEFLRANNTPPKLTIQVNTLKTGVEEYCELLRGCKIEYELSESVPGCIELSGGAAAALPGFEEGLFYVQDRAARCAAVIANPEKGMAVLDACSCPGGKSFAAAIAMLNEGSIRSCDIHEKKLNLVISGAERLGINIISTEAMDARTFSEDYEEKFDVVIADVPCSGIGVVAKKPEIRNKTWNEISSMPQIQADILENLSRYVKPGGVILYSTCTIIKEENEDVVSAFLGKRVDFKAEAFSLGSIQAAEGMYTFWPNIDGTDGFFAAKLRKEKK